MALAFFVPEQKEKHMIESPDDDEIFDSIMEENDMAGWLKQSHVNAITIQDIYEGLSLMSDVQVDLHEYLKTVILAIFKNNKAKNYVEEIPQLTQKQVVHLKQIFESAALFLEE